MKTIVVNFLLVGAMLGMAGCTDLKPLQADLDGLKTQVDSLGAGVTGARTAAETASRAASQASQAAASAQSSANQALAEARSQQGAIADINARIDRMFRKSVSK